VSRKGERTRHTVLTAAAELLRAHGPGRVTMADVAGRSGLTRQALYLHFPTRTRLMLALIDHIGQQAGKLELFGPLERKPRARAELDDALRALARYAARIHPVASALDLARHTDPDAEAAWESRMKLRRRRLQRLVERIAAEGALRPGWSVRRVTDALWTLSSPRGYADYVVERGASLTDYERYLLTAASGFFSRRAQRLRSARSPAPSGRALRAAESG
jgi:AcrR family transcriptional regulator